MLAISLAQLKSHASRLVATALAIGIAVAFVVATLVLNQTSEATVTGAVAAQYAGTDAVVAAAPGTGGLNAPPGLADRLRKVPGVRAADTDLSTSAPVRLPGFAGLRDASITAVAADPQLRWQRLDSGRLPRRGGEIAIGSPSGLRVGDRLTLLPGNGDRRPRPVELTVVGVVDLRATVAGSGDTQLFVTAAQATAWGAIPDVVRIAGDGSRSPDQLRTDVRRIVTSNDLVVRTGHEQATAVADGYTGGAAGIASVLLVFATVAVFVCALVIANTFAVLLAQRTRELGLLRCVGSTAAQVRRGVLVESVVIGLVASAGGVLAGIGLAGGASALAGHLDSPIPLSGLSVPVSAVLIGMAVGTAVTVLSAIVPAQRATRVAPLAALRPFDDAPLRSRRGLARRASGILLLAGGAAGLALGAAGGVLMVALPGGVVSFLGVVLLSRWAVPPVVSGAGRLLGRAGGTPGDLAASNAVRNPQRTAATATALIIGVTLTTTMVVGAASTRASARSFLDEAFPTDVLVSSNDGGSMPAGVGAAVGHVNGVRAAATVTGTDLTANGLTTEVLGIDPATAGPAVRSATGAGVPGEGQITVPPDHLTDWGPAGTTLTLRKGGRHLDLTVVEAHDAQQPAVSRSDLARLAPAAGVRQVWVRLADTLDDDQRQHTIDGVTEAAAGVAPLSSVAAATDERDRFDKLVNTLLLVVTALLAVAVMIALIGVGNTLALSVLERRQESGLLRAVGLTRAQLRLMLLWEAVLISGVAAVLGTVLGIVYGAAGTMAALSGQGSITVAVPWPQVIGIVAVAAVAGALASVLPARRAARVSPVAAMATL